METLILLANLAALAAGGAVVVLAYRMDREYRLPHHRDYLVFVVLTVVSGFFDWVLFNFVSVFGPVMTWGERDAIYHIFWDIIGFPCAMAAAAWLLFTLTGLLNVRLDKRKKRILAAPFLLIGLLSIVRALPVVNDGSTSLGKVLWIVFTLALPLFEVVVLAFAYGLAWKFRDRSGIFVRQFILLLFFGYSVWHALSLIPSRFHPSYHWSILWFYLFLLPPTLLLRRRTLLLQRLETLEDFSDEALAPFYERFGLTDREKDVVLLLLKGKSYKAMKDELFVSLQTVKNYVSRIYGKLNVRNRVELVNLARNMTRLQ